MSVYSDIIFSAELAANIADEESTKEAIVYPEEFGKDTAGQQV